MLMYHTLFDVYTVNAVTIFFFMQATLEYLGKNGMRKSHYRHFIFLNSSVRGQSPSLHN